MSNVGFSFLNIARENGLSTADAIQNANNIQKYLATPEADRNSLDGALMLQSQPYLSLLQVLLWELL